MASEKKSFSELLEEAPLASSKNTIQITGVLARSREPGKFILTTGEGQTVTLDVEAVKEHRVLSGMIGQTIVQVEVDRDQAPEEIRSGVQVQANFRKPPLADFTVTFLDHPMTPPWSPTHSDVFQDYPFKNISEGAGTIQEQYVDPASFQGDPAAAQAAMPFALATPHQAPGSPIHEASLGMGYNTGIWDLQTLHRYDKSVLQDLPHGFAAGDPTSVASQFQAAHFRTLPYRDETVIFRDKPPIADITGHYPYID